MKKRKTTAAIISFIENGELTIMTDVQRIWLTADPDKLLYNAVDCICLDGSIWGTKIHPYEFAEITVDAISRMMQDNGFVR